MTVDGVSLTVTEVDDTGFSVSLIPETLARTTLGTGRPGRPVNLEVDVIAKHVEKLLQDERETRSPFASIEDALEDIRAGRMVVVCDDEDRENEGDLTLAAQFATPENINFMAREARGLICLALTPDRCDELGLDLMAAKNESAFETAFTVSVEAREGVTTGISAHDRAHTIQVAIDPAGRARRPGAARTRLPAQGPARWGARAYGADRGGGGPGSSRGADPGRGDLRGDARRRPDGADQGPDPLLRAPRPEDDHRRRPGQVPAADGEARRPRRGGQPADRVRRVQRGRLSVDDRRQASRRTREGRRGRGSEGPARR